MYVNVLLLLKDTYYTLAFENIYNQRLWTSFEKVIFKSRHAVCEKQRRSF